MGLSSATHPEAPRCPRTPTSRRTCSTRSAHDGVVLLPQVLSADWMNLVDLGIRRNLGTPGPYFQHHYDGTPRAFIDDYCNYWAIPEYRMLVEHSPIAEIVASVLGSERLWLFYEQIFVKDAAMGEARRTPWHQDITYWITGGTQLAGFWITLDDTPAEDSLEFVRGSHLGPVYAGTAFDYARTRRRRMRRRRRAMPASPTSRPIAPPSTSCRSRSGGATPCCSIQGCCTGAAHLRGVSHRARCRSASSATTSPMYGRSSGPRPSTPASRRCAHPARRCRGPWFPQVHPRGACARRRRRPPSGSSWHCAYDPPTAEGRLAEKEARRGSGDRRFAAVGDRCRPEPPADHRSDPDARHAPGAHNGPAFALGWVLGLVVVSVVVAACHQRGRRPRPRPRLGVDVGQLVIGVLFLSMALRSGGSDPSRRGAALPEWMATIDRFSAGKSSGSGRCSRPRTRRTWRSTAAAAASIAQLGSAAATTRSPSRCSSSSDRSRWPGRSLFYLFGRRKAAEPARIDQAVHGRAQRRHHDGRAALADPSRRSCSTASRPAAACASCAPSSTWPASR